MIAAVSQAITQDATSERVRAVEAEDDAILLAPARRHGQVTGAIAIARARGMRWALEERALLAGVGNHLGIAFAQIADRAALQRLSRTDELTGLLNRRAFFEDLEQRLAHLARMRRCSALFYVDLDNFKAVNDENGHAAGDTVLRTVAELLRHNTRAGDLVARLGGDEFALWIEEVDEAKAAAKATALVQSAAALQRLSARAAPLGISVGAALSGTAEGHDLATLITRADQAMYEAKRAGKGTYAITPAPPPSDGQWSD